MELISLKKQTRGRTMTTLAIVGAGVVAYGVTRTITKRNGQREMEMNNDFDIPEIFQ
jgi:predicted amino acid dehydrogenase